MLSVALAFTEVVPRSSESFQGKLIEVVGAVVSRSAEAVAAPWKGLRIMLPAIRARDPRTIPIRLLLWWFRLRCVIAAPPLLY
jgi:hypothetical protein